MATVRRCAAVPLVLFAGCAETSDVCGGELAIGDERAAMDLTVGIDDVRSNYHMEEPNLTCEVDQLVDRRWISVGVVTMGVCERFFFEPKEIVLDIDAYSLHPRLDTPNPECHTEGSGEYELERGVNALTVNLECEASAEETDNYVD